MLRLSVVETMTPPSARALLRALVEKFGVTFPSFIAVAQELSYASLSVPWYRLQVSIDAISCHELPAALNSRLPTEISEASLRVGMDLAAPMPLPSPDGLLGRRLLSWPDVLSSLPALPRLPFLLPTRQALPVQLAGFEAPLQPLRPAPEPPLERTRSS